MSRRPLSMAPFLACGLLLVGGLAGCSSDEPSQADAEAAVCQSIAGVRTAAMPVKDLSATSTVEEAQDAKQGLEDALADLKSSVEDLADADAAAVDAAVGTIGDAISDVSGSDTLGAAGAAVKGSTAALDTALDQMSNGLGCVN